MRGPEHPGRMAEIEIELTTPGEFLRTVCHGVVNRFAADDVTRVCGNDVLLNRVSQSMMRQLFDMFMFRVLYHTHCNPILAFWRL